MEVVIAAKSGTLLRALIVEIASKRSSVHPQGRGLH